jgi:hypothetical protein
VVQPLRTVTEVVAITTPIILELTLIVAEVPTFHHTFTSEVGQLIIFTVTPVPDAPKVRVVPTLKIQYALAFPPAFRVTVLPAVITIELAAV